MPAEYKMIMFMNNASISAWWIISLLWHAPCPTVTLTLMKSTCVEPGFSVT